VLVAVNGVFALSELAIVSARRPKLRAMAGAGRPGAAAAATERRGAERCAPFRSTPR
jgi:CBS domain containing-hemolysin-like protein